jgi:hypothetical protein
MIAPRFSNDLRTRIDLLIIDRRPDVSAATEVVDRGD